MEDEKACAAYEAALCRDFSNLKMIRANSSGSSNQTPEASASLVGESTEANDTEVEGQEEDPREFALEEPEETAAMGDGPDLVCGYQLYADVLALNRP